MNRVETIAHLSSMKDGEMYEQIRSAGILRSTRAYYKNSSDSFEMHCTNGTWVSAMLTKEQMANYLLGEITDSDLEWR